MPNSLQPVDCSLPVSSVHGIFKARKLGVPFSIPIGSCCSVAQSCLTPCDPMDACQTSQSFTISQSLLKLMSIESVVPSSHLVLRCPLLLLPSIFPSINVFSNESALRIRWPKYWSFSFSISSSNEYSGMISFRIDWFDLLAVQGTQWSSPAPQFESISLVLSKHPGMTPGGLLIHSAHSLTS